jgi:hypothetical protein
MALDPPIELPPIAPGEPIVLSASTFVVFTRCPEEAAGRLRGLYPAESRAAFTGGLAHRLFARHLSGSPIPPADLSTACREEIGGSMNYKLAALRLRPSELTRVIDEVGILYERFRHTAAAGLVGAEVRMEVFPAEGVTLRGVVDAVFDDGEAGVRLVDWKTGALGDPTAQLRFYALLWALDKGDLPGRVEAVSVGNGERTEEVPSRAGVAATAGEVSAAIGMLRRAFSTGEHLRQTAGPWCRWCPLLPECEEGRAATALLDG